VGATRGRLGLKDFDPCTILLNTTWSAGGCREQLPREPGTSSTFLPPVCHAGWAGGGAKTNHLSADLRRGGEEVRQACWGMEPGG